MQYRYGRWLAYCVLVLAAHSATAQTQDNGVTHEVSATAGSKGRTGMDTVAKRLENQALKYQKEHPGAPIARIVDFDTAFPKDATEFARMDKFAVMLVTAVTHDQTELPVKVYFTLNGKSSPLPEIADMRRDVPPDSRAYAAFGPYREDVFVLVPAILLFTKASFVADFAVHRSGFEFGQGPLDAPDYLAADHALVTVPATSGPPPDVVKNLIAREYPGFWPN